MTRLRKHLTRDEKGQALIVVLILLALGSLLVVACLGYADTSLLSRRALEKNSRSVYAADAGIEDVLLCLKNSLPTRLALPQNLNGMSVTMQTETKGVYILYAGEFVPASVHYSWLLISGDMSWDEGANAYKFIITTTRSVEASGNIQLFQVGTRLPFGYTYKPGSAASFGGNLSTSEPTDELEDGSGAHLLNWVLPLPRPSLKSGDPTRTQIFYATGGDDSNDHYSWAVAQSDIGPVSDLIGTFYIITATATDPQSGDITLRIVANVMSSADGNIYITSWQISPN